MLQTLPLVLFIIMTEVSIGSVSVLVFLDWRNEVKRGFLISYGLIYLALTGLTYLFQQGFAYPGLLNTYQQLDKAWTGYLTLPLLLFFLLLIPYNVFLWIDRSAGVDSKVKQVKAEAQGQSSRFSIVRLLRLLSGAVTVAGFFAAAFALGGVLTAMWLGHWYLVTPALSEKPLQFATTLVLVAILAQVLFTITAGPTTVPVNQPPGGTSVTAPATPAPGTNVKPANAPVITPISTGAIGWLHILVGFIIPLVLGALAWKLIRDRSFQSATGMLYLVVVCTLAGEAMARGLFLMGL